MLSKNSHVCLLFKQHKKNAQREITKEINISLDLVWTNLLMFVDA